MAAIRQNAEDTTRAFFKKLYREKGGKPLHAIDHMDEGTPIVLTVTIDGETGDAVFDFEGTGLAVYGNINAPKAVANAAITYSVSTLRCPPAYARSAV